MELRALDTFKYGDIKIQALNQNVFAYVREHRDADSFVVVINLGENHENVNLKIFSTLRDKLKVVAASPASDYVEGWVFAFMCDEKCEITRKLSWDNGRNYMR